MAAKHLLVFLLCIASFAQSQELARRSYLGVEVIQMHDRVVVRSVLPDSTASKAGIQPGDELLRINGQTVSGSADLAELQHAFRAGSKIDFTVTRGGILSTKTAVAVPMPLQTDPAFDTVYKTVVVDGSNYRAILTKPKGNGRYPAVFLIGGLGCYSLDPLRESSPYGQILYSLTRDGYVTMRVDKSGEGDSEGPACNSDAATLSLAAQRSIAGLRALRTYDFVDPSRIFVFAHSLGPVEGALVIGRVPVRGFVASETIGKSWFDYEVEIARSQPLLLGQSYTEVEAFARKNLECMSLFYLQGLSETDVVKAQPTCADDVPSLAGMPSRYFRDIAKVNLAEEWKQADIPVLVTYGTSDPLTSAAESKYLVDLINSFHPRRAKYMEFKHMSHHFDWQPDQSHALRDLQNGRNGPYDPTFVQRIVQWMNSI